MKFEDAEREYIHATSPESKAAWREVLLAIALRDRQLLQAQVDSLTSMLDQQTMQRAEQEYMNVTTASDIFNTP